MDSVKTVLCGLMLTAWSSVIINTFVLFIYLGIAIIPGKSGACALQAGGSNTRVLVLLTTHAEGN